MTRFLMAIQTLTRLPIREIDWNEVDYGKASLYFPLVGLIVGVHLYLLYLVSNMFFPPIVMAAILLIGNILLTGGIHLDGFMDTVDGVFSGRSKERKLEIMKDSRVGANAVVGLFSLLLLKFTLLLYLPIELWQGLPLMVGIGRWVMVYSFFRFPYARPEGLGRAHQQYTTRLEFFGALATISLAAFLLWKVQGLIALLVCTLIAHFLASRLCKAIGGLTGDTYGALGETIEVAFLILVYLLVGIL